MKKCKYCKSEINEEAIVCPICKRNQNQRRNINIAIIIIGNPKSTKILNFFFNSRLPLKLYHYNCQFDNITSFIQKLQI